MKFKELLLLAKVGDKTAITAFIEHYKPMLIKSSIINGVFDEDLYQELCVVLMKCIEHFVI